MPTAELTIALDGSLALETNVSQHSGDQKSFRIFKDLVTDVGNRIVKRDGKGATLGSVAGTEIQFIHEYVYVDPTTGAETYHTLGAIDGGSYIYRWDGATTWTGQTLPITPTAGGRWFFYNADNRVFLCNGKDALLVAAQAQAFVTLTSVGVTATATSALPHGFSNGETVTIGGATPAAYNGAYVITVTGATTFTYTFAGGASPATGTISATVTTRIVWRAAGVDAPTFAPTYSLTTTNPPVSSTSTVTTVSCTQGSVTVTNSGTAFVTGGAWVGKRIEINGIAYTISSVTSTSILVLTEGFKETTAAGLSWTVYPGIGDWDDIAPKYAFSYYNPTTGHASNPSPTLQVTETAQRGRTITITIAWSAENTTAYNNGYTQIQLFRTAKSSGILVALNEKLTNNNTATAITYIETATKFADTYLTDLEAPTKNRKPPSGLACLAFHQGRLWGQHASTGKLYFTPIGVEIDFGVYAECWPALYTRTVYGMRGLVVVGGSSSADSLVIQTSRGDFSIDGYDSTTFAPYKLQTRQSGGYLGTATSVDGDLVQFYGDKRLLVMKDDIARAVQDKLDAVKDSLISKVRLHWHSAKSRNYLLLSVPKDSSSVANDYTYVFNLDKEGAPYEWNFGVSAFGTVHNASTLAIELFAGDPAGAIYRLLTGNNQDAGANFAPTLRSGLIRFPEEKAVLKYVKLFVNDATGTWTGRVFLNENTNTGATDGTHIAMTFRVSDYREQSAQGKELIYTFTASQRRTAKVFQIDLTFPGANSALWIEKVVIGFDNKQEVGAQS